MRLGRLREVITVSRETLTPDGAGGHLSSWATIATVHAEVIGLRGQEAVEVAVLRSASRWRVIFRRLPGLTAADQLIWQRSDGDPPLRLNILTVGPHPEHRDMVVITAESGLQ